VEAAMHDEEELAPKGPQVDFSFQLNMARDRSEKKIFSYLCEISEKFHKDNKRIGVLVILGVFGSARSSLVDGMRKLTTDKLDIYINVNFSQFKEDLIKVFESGEDGAIIINQDGQILAEKVYLTVDNPTLEIPEGAGTRHITAASFSTRKDVLAAFTLSEESYFVRVWKDGEYTEQFNPDKKED
jgi:DNA integrity scanning protein DisA with diadenylate cyclase activity